LLVQTVLCAGFFLSLLGITGGPTVHELLANPSFEQWRGGLPVGWGNVTDPEASLEASSDAVDGAYSLSLRNVRSYDVYVYQNVTIPPGSEASIGFSVWCKILYSEDIDIHGVHSPTGIEVGFEGGDVDGDGFSEYLYFYFFVDDDVRPEDFTELAGIYNTTQGVSVHKIALLHRLQRRDLWQRFEFNLSKIFLDTLGGYPRGEYKVMVWALRWGEPREGVGLTGLVDGMTVNSAAAEAPEEGGGWATIFTGLVVGLVVLRSLGSCGRGMSHRAHDSLRQA